MGFPISVFFTVTIGFCILKNIQLQGVSNLSSSRITGVAKYLIIILIYGRHTDNASHQTPVLTKGTLKIFLREID